MTATRLLEWWYGVLPVAFLLEYALAFLLIRLAVARIKRDRLPSDDGR